MAGHWGIAEQIIKTLVGDGCSPKRVACDAGHIIHETETPADHFYLIETGEVRVLHVSEGGATRVVDILGSGDWFGTAVLAGLPMYGKRAVAIRPSVIWVLDAEELRRELVKRGDLAMGLVESMAVRLLAAWNQDSEMVAQSCRTRIIKTLLRFSDSPAAETVQGEITLHMTHSQLARVIGAARESVSACLTELRRNDIIRTGRNKLKFNIHRLKALENSPTIPTSKATAHS